MNALISTASKLIIDYARNWRDTQMNKISQSAGDRKSRYLAALGHVSAKGRGLPVVLDVNRGTIVNRDPLIGRNMLTAVHGSSAPPVKMKRSKFAKQPRKYLIVGRGEQARKYTPAYTRLILDQEFSQ